MMSDVLFEALDEIERYQSQYPTCYDGLRGEIERVKAAMSGLLRRLDLPAGPDPTPVSVAGTPSEAADLRSPRHRGQNPALEVRPVAPEGCGREGSR